LNASFADNPPRNESPIALVQSAMVFNGTVRIAASLCGLVYERIPSTGNRSAGFFRELS
jgi:hypothetical protein